ncbi:MAG TPA: biopolymer transporter ExbD [Pyrinomonadaceae bacterium]|nr:biopolymer transporter ExbD [Pyrinomonadaceae bacterium]
MGMGGGNSGEGSRAVPYINVTPLIDVLLVLLIIFMVVTPLKPSRFKALIPTPPKEEQTQATAFELNLRVDIAKDLKMQLNGQDMGTVNDTGQLSTTLAGIFQQRKDRNQINPATGELYKTVFIKAPKSVKYGEVVKVIDAVKGAGASPVGLQVDALDQ